MRRRPKVSDSAAFNPQVDLVVGMDDMVHVQWTGNDDTKYNGNNNGEGMDNEDRHNIVHRASSTTLQPHAIEAATLQPCSVSATACPQAVTLCDPGAAR